MVYRHLRYRLGAGRTARLLLLFALIAMMLQFPPSIAARGGWVIFMAILPAGGMLVGVLLPSRMLGAPSDDDIAHAMRLTQVCPACGYDLHDLKAEVDGCTVCPECGAAWRIEASKTEPQA